MMADRVSSLALGYLGCTIAVEADGEHLAWLREFLAPPFAVLNAGMPAHRVLYTTDPSRYTTLSARGPDPQGRNLRCFAFDQRDVAYPLWHGEHGETVLFDAEFRTFYVVDGEHADVEVVAHRENRWPRVALMRVVREIAMAHAEAGGALSIHGAAVALDGRAAILAGPKRSGKTSLLIHALLHPGARLLANDRLMMSGDRGAWRATGMPTVVNIRPGTRALFADAFAKVRDDPTLASLSLDERARRTEAPRGRDDGALVLNPMQLCELAGVERAGTTELAAIVLPRVDEGRRGIELARLDPRAALDRLRDAVFPSAVRFLYARATSGACPGRTGDSGTLGKVADSIACFDCTLGQDAYRAESRADFFARLLGNAA